MGRPQLRVSSFFSSCVLGVLACCRSLSWLCVDWIGGLVGRHESVMHSVWQEYSWGRPADTYTSPRHRVVVEQSLQRSFEKSNDFCRFRYNIDEVGRSIKQ